MSHLDELKDTYLKIAGMLSKKINLNDICSKERGLGVSGRTVGDVKRLIDEGYITIDAQGTPALTASMEQIEAFLEEYKLSRGMIKERVRKRMPTKTESAEQAVEKVFKGEVAKEARERTCVSEDSEILTISGWRNYKQIKEGDLVLTLNIKENKLEYNPIQRVFSYFHTGNAIHIKTTSIDAIFSPEHRVLIQRRNTNFLRNIQRNYNGIRTKWHGYEFLEAKKCFRSVFRIPACGKFNGSETIDDALLKTLAWTITEGSRQLQHGKKDGLNIWQSISRHPEYIEEIRSALAGTDFSFAEYPVTRQGYSPAICFHVHEPDATKICEELNNLVHDIPKNLLNLNQRQLRLLYKTLMNGDGGRYKYRTRISRKLKERDASFHPGLNKKLADQFQELCIKIGIRSKVVPKGNQYIVKISKNRPFHVIQKDRRRKNPVFEEEYKGIMWCVATKNKTFVARRNGCAFITGNSQYMTIGKTVATAYWRWAERKGIPIEEAVRHDIGAVVSEALEYHADAGKLEKKVMELQDALRAAVKEIDPIVRLKSACILLYRFLEFATVAELVGLNVEDSGLVDYYQQILGLYMRGGFAS